MKKSNYFYEIPHEPMNSKISFSHGRNVVDQQLIPLLLFSMIFYLLFQHLGAKTT